MMNRYFVVLFLTVIWFGSYVNWWSYPIREFVDTNCQYWEKYCNASLPIIENVDYRKYKNNSYYRGIYSMLWATTYFDGWDVWIWTHLWVDISVPKWTNVYSMWDGIIIEASDRWDRWKLVIVEHIFKWRKIYSSYSHLDDMYVNIWDSVSEDTIIWIVWDTGNATWPHLHFQIDINDDGKYPFFPRWCSGSIDQIVNESRCQEQVLKNTVDPILFIEKQWNIGIKNTTYFEKKQNLESNSFIFSGDEPRIVWKWEVFDIFVNSLNNKDFDDLYILNGVLSVDYNDKILKSNLDRVLIIGTWRNFSFRSLSQWFLIINFEYNGKIIKKVPIIVIDPDINWGLSEEKILLLENLLKQIRL